MPDARPAFVGDAQFGDVQSVPVHPRHPVHQDHAVVSLPTIGLPRLERSSRAASPYRGLLLVGVRLMTDVVALLIAVLTARAVIARWGGPETVVPDFATSAVIVLSFLTAFAVNGAYTRRAWAIPTTLSDLRGAWHAITLGVLLSLIATRPMGDGADLATASAVGALGLLLVPVGHAASVARTGGGGAERVLIIGSGRVARIVARRLERTHGVIVVGMVDEETQGHGQLLGSPDELEHVCAVHAVDRVVVAFSRQPSHILIERLRRLQASVEISLVPQFFEMLNWQARVEELYGIPIVHVPRTRRGRLSRLGKRCLDVVVATATLVLLSPLILAIAVAVKVTSPGPVLFRQTRAGQHGRPFDILKFRTMCADAESRLVEVLSSNEVDGPIFKMSRDPRVTKLGRWLRRTSLDELPQLLNVVKGDMSLVGPRPFPVDEAARLGQWSVSRDTMRPGMTGLWQVSGRNALTYDDLLHLDSVYVASWSLLWDLRILLQTPSTVLTGRGIL